MSEHLNLNEITQTFSNKITHAPALTGTLKVIIENVGTVYLENIDNTNLITQKIDIKDQLILSKINNAGSGCSPNGSLSRTSTGVLLSCVFQS